MYLSVALTLLLSTPTVIGHDIEVVWEKGYVQNDSGFIFGRGIGAGDLDGDGYQDIAASWGFYDRDADERRRVFPTPFAFCALCYFRVDV